MLLANSEALCIVLLKSPQDIIKKIPLSNNFGQTRIDEMAENVRDTLSSILMTKEFAMQHEFDT